MTAQVNSQPVTDQNIWYIDMCCINNSISCLEKKMSLGTHDQTCYVTLCVCLLRLQISTPRTYWCAPELCDLSCATSKEKDFEDHEENLECDFILEKENNWKIVEACEEDDEENLENGTYHCPLCEINNGTES